MPNLLNILAFFLPEFSFPLSFQGKIPDTIIVTSHSIAVMILKQEIKTQS